MVACVFDGTIEGFFTAVFDLYKEKISPDFFCTAGALQQSLDMRLIKTQTQAEKAARIKNFIIRHTKAAGFDEVVKAFGSCHQNKCSIIFDYLKVVFEHKGDVPYMLGDRRVMDFFDLSRKVSLECHRMLGFIRFKECLGGIYYAEYAPDNDITQFIMPHFCKRFNDMAFVIRDVRRNIAGIYNKKEYRIFYGLGVFNVDVTDDERQFLNIWKMYYNTIAIKQRKNTRLMKRSMPVRYWKFLDEKKDG
jgi:probable DNA metabolism protein